VVLPRALNDDGVIEYDRLASAYRQNNNRQQGKR
jgi:hypothetical protein